MVGNIVHTYIKAIVGGQIIGDDDENKPIWPTWAAGALSRVLDVEIYNRAKIIGGSPEAQVGLTRFRTLDPPNSDTTA
jgi:hypothetical protein